MTRTPAAHPNLLIGLTFLLATAFASPVVAQDGDGGFGAGLVPAHEPEASDSKEDQTTEPEPAPTARPEPQRSEPASSEAIAQPEEPRRRDDVYFDWSRATVGRVDLYRFYPSEEEEKATTNFHVEMFSANLPIIGHPADDQHLVHIVGKLMEGEGIWVDDDYGSEGGPASADTFSFAELGLRYDGPWFGAQLTAHAFALREERLNVLTPGVALRVGSPRWGVLVARADLHDLFAGSFDSEAERSLTNNLDLELEGAVVLASWFRLEARARHRDVYDSSEALRITDRLYALGFEVAPVTNALRVSTAFFGLGVRHVLADTGTRIDGPQRAARWVEDQQLLLLADISLGPAGLLAW